jgi:hypothetical protein
MSKDNVETRKKALIIAISDYDDKRLRPLEFCKNDGEQMHQLLSSLGFEISDNHKLIGYTQFDRMRGAIYDFFDNRKTKADDILLFYYSGHGIPISDGNILASSETDHYSPREMGFSSYELTNLIQESNSIRIVEVLDCCYAGSAKVGKGSEEDAAKLGIDAMEKNAEHLKQGEGKFLLAASQAAEEAFGLREKGHSIFTYYLLEGLKGNEKSVDSEGNVTPDSLGNYVYKEIINLPLDKRPKQKPIRKTEASGEIILAHYASMAKGTSPLYSTLLALGYFQNFLHPALSQKSDFYVDGTKYDLTTYVFYVVLPDGDPDEGRTSFSRYVMNKGLKHVEIKSPDRDRGYPVLGHTLQDGRLALYDYAATLSAVWQTVRFVEKNHTEGLKSIQLRREIENFKNTLVNLIETDETLHFRENIVLLYLSDLEKENSSWK